MRDEVAPQLPNVRILSCGIFQVAWGSVSSVGNDTLKLCLLGFGASAGRFPSADVVAHHFADSPTITFNTNFSDRLVQVLVELAHH